MSHEPFDRWLDDGMPDSGAKDAHAHAGSCARCSASLAAAREIEAMLEHSASVAPAGFTDRVMSRVAATSARGGAASVRALETQLVAGAMPWWVRAASDPAVVLSAAIAALVAWRGDQLWRLAGVAAGAVSLAWRGVPGVASRLFAGWSVPAAAPTLADPVVQLGMMLALAALLAVASIPLYRWCERVSAGLAVPTRRGARTLPAH
jgi:hypothetical protein